MSASRCLRAAAADLAVTAGAVGFGFGCVASAPAAPAVAPARVIFGGPDLGDGAGCVSGVGLGEGCEARSALTPLVVGGVWGLDAGMGLGSAGVTMAADA